MPDEVILGNGLNPQGYNLTAYVLNQPLRFIDPTGRAPLESVGNFLGEQADKLVATGGATLHVVAGALDGISPVPLNTQPDPDHELAFAVGQIIGGMLGLTFDAWIMANGTFIAVDGAIVCAGGPTCGAGAPMFGIGVGMYAGGSILATQKHGPSMGEGLNKIINQMSSVGNGAPSNTRPGARFIVEPNGTVVDTKVTPKGSYQQPSGARTDILQGGDHGAGHSHTHDPIFNVNPKTGQAFQRGLEKPGRAVSPEEVENIESGVAVPAKPKGR